MSKAILAGSGKIFCPRPKKISNGSHFLTAAFYLRRYSKMHAPLRLSLKGMAKKRKRNKQLSTYTHMPKEAKNSLKLLHAEKLDQTDLSNIL
jgi:acyl carrier protein phosphodiesterase